MVVVSAGHEGGARGSAIVSVDGVLGMSVVHGMRGVGGGCEMYLFGSGSV